MKHLIIEGFDRTGKDTLIKNILQHCKTAFITHFSRPLGSSDEERTEYQKISFENEFLNALNIQHTHNFFKIPEKMNLLIWNRSHLGELVYAKLYRNSNPEKWVYDLEKKYVHSNMFLILLSAPSEFLQLVDDNQSYAKSIDDIKKEHKLFFEAFEKSSIPNKMIIDVEENMNYVSQNSILNTTLKFLL